MRRKPCLQHRKDENYQQNQVKARRERDRGHSREPRKAPGQKAGPHHPGRSEDDRQD
jgi:hypothetical protein